jgi:hypothetical protein
MRAATLTALIGLSAQLFLLDPSSAADYSSRPIKLLVGALAGGITDTMARTIAQALSSLFGQPVLVENRPVLAATLLRKRSHDRRLTAIRCWSASPATRSTQRSIRNCRSIWSLTSRQSR